MPNVFLHISHYTVLFDPKHSNMLLHHLCKYHLGGYMIYHHIGYTTVLFFDYPLWAF